MAETTESVRAVIRKKVENVFVRAYLTASQENLAGNAWTKILLNAVDIDLGLNFDTVNSKFIVPVTGLYEIIANVQFTNTVADRRYITGIYKNGSSIREQSGHASLISSLGVECKELAFLQEADEIELYAQPEAGGGTDTVDISSGTKATLLMIRLTTKEGTRQ